MPDTMLPVNPTPQPAPAQPAEPGNVGPWDRDPAPQDRNESDYVLGRLLNLTKTAEGPTVPPVMQSGVRVVSPTAFQITNKVNYEQLTVYTLSWVEAPEMASYQPSYRIRVTGGQGDIYTTVTSSPATIAVPLRNVPGATVTFRLETRLSNGLVASEDTWPATSDVVAPVENFLRKINSSYAADSNDRIIMASMVATPYTLTMPDITTLPTGGLFFYIKIYEGGLTLTLNSFNSVQTMDGVTTQTMDFTNPDRIFLCDGEVWRSFIPT